MYVQSLSESLPESRALSRRASVAAVAAFCAAGLAGCAGDRNSPAQQAVEAAKKPELQSTFVSGCVRGSSIFGYERRSIEMNGNDVTIVTHGYGLADSACVDSAVELKETGKFETGGSSPGGDNIQFLLDKASIRPKSEAGRVLLNSAPPSGACGINDWKIDEERDVTAKTGEATCADKTPRTLYDIYAIEGTTLFLGKGQPSDKAGADKRPTQLDRDMPYRRK